MSLEIPAIADGNPFIKHNQLSRASVTIHHHKCMQTTLFHMQRGFEVEEPDVYQYKQRKTKAATVVDEDGGTGSKRHKNSADGDGNEADLAAKHGQRGERGNSSGKKRSKEEKRLLLGLDGDIERRAKANPSTTISKSVLKMFAS